MDSGVEPGPTSGPTPDSQETTPVSPPRPKPGDPDFKQDDFKQEDAILLSASKGGFYTDALSGISGFLDDRATADMAQVRPHSAVYCIIRDIRNVPSICVVLMKKLERYAHFMKFSVYASIRMCVYPSYS
jgi:hypothetical protein